MNHNVKIKTVEVFDVSRVAMALHSMGFKFEVKESSIGTTWFDVYVECGDTLDETAAGSVIGSILSLPDNMSLSDVRHMATCCGIGYLAQGNEEYCPSCGAKRKID